MSLNDIFGTFPGRPDHPDMTKLVDIILQQDGKTEDADFDMESHLSSIIDPTSVSFLSLQRAIRIANSVSDKALLAKLSTMWIDGFLVGVELAKRAAVDASVVTAKFEIRSDIVSGRFKATDIECFADLHDHVDANMYGNLDSNDLDHANAVQDKLDAWIRGGGLLPD